ncbi:MAG: tetratricopeptide repeat protein [Armatimonadetes bacterium]|nr:tetratricopeptide repeat protein [Armatimonadota bacterium]
MSAQQNRKKRLTSADYLKKADELEANGEFEKAIELLNKAIRTAKDKPLLYYRLAVLCRSQRRMDDAILAAKRALRIKPDDLRSRDLLLEILLELGRVDDAIKEAKELLKYSPHSLSARDVLSIAYLQKGMLEKALQVTNELISLDPMSPLNHFKKAVLYQQKGDIGNAVQEFTRVLEMQPDEDTAREARQAIEVLDNYQLRHILMLAAEDYIFRAKLIRDPAAAALERGFYLSYSGMATLKQIQFEELPEVWAEWKQKFYH